MSIRYIANSTGVPESKPSSTAIGLPTPANEDKPLDLLGQEQHYPGGPRALGRCDPERAGTAKGHAMSFGDLNDLLLTYIVTYGAVVLASGVLAGRARACRCQARCVSWPAAPSSSRARSMSIQHDRARVGGRAAGRHAQLWHGPPATTPNSAPVWPIGARGGARRRISRGAATLAIFPDPLRADANRRPDQPDRRRAATIRSAALWRTTRPAS